MEYKLHNLREEDAKQVALGNLLPVMEEFYSIQGEGYNAGIPSYFIRLGGCDIGCHWCDVKESWNANLHPLTYTAAVIENVLATPAKAVVVTGGEPLLYNLFPLSEKLREKNIKTFIETSGAYPLSGVWDWVCLSPKKNQPPLNEAYMRADELKVIVHNKHDFIWAQEQAAKTNERAHRYLQPEWSKSSELLPLIIDFVKKNPSWRISLQTHKYMHIP